jgi:hypothetical protein
MKNPFVCIKCGKKYCNNKRVYFIDICPVCKPDRHFEHISRTKKVNKNEQSI